MTTKKSTYKGLLATGIPCFRLDTAMERDPHFRAEWEKELDQARVKKLGALFDHYKISVVHDLEDGTASDRSLGVALIDLIIQLAADHVPGFRPVVPRGPKKKSHFELWYAVSSRRQAEIDKGKKPNVSAICNSLTKKGAQFSSMNPKTLKRRYELEDKNLSNHYVARLLGHMRG